MEQEYLYSPCEALRAIIDGYGVRLREVSSKMHVSTPSLEKQLQSETGQVRTETLIFVAGALGCSVYVETPEGKRYKLKTSGKYENRVRKYPTRLAVPIRQDVMNIDDD